MPSTPTEAKTLKPCPFCGGQKIVDGYIRDGRRIFCAGRDCSASVEAFHPDASASAAALWNRRTVDPSLLSLIEDMAKALKPLSKVAEEFDRAETDRKNADPVWGYNNATVTYGDFRDARATLSRYTEFMEQNNG